MNKKIFFVLLPFCTSLLLGCEGKRYTLTIKNSNKDAGTIVEGPGLYHAGEKVKIICDVAQGYTITRWEDDQNNKIGSHPSFNYEMPKRDVKLTVNYDYDKYDFKVNSTFESDENHYDFRYSNKDDCYSFFYVNGEMYSSESKKYKWHDEVTITHMASFIATNATFIGFCDQTGEALGNDTSYTFEMPNYDYTIYAKYQSTSYCAAIYCKYADVLNNIGTPHSGGSSTTKDGDYSVCYVCFGDDDVSPLTLNLSYLDDSKYNFEGWYDMDSDELVSSNAYTQIADYTGFHRYECKIELK